jgi:hypothetical protein
VVEVSIGKVLCLPVASVVKARTTTTEGGGEGLAQDHPGEGLCGQDSIKLFRSAISLDTISTPPLGYVAALVPENINPESFSPFRCPRNLVSSLGHSCPPGFCRSKENHFRYRPRNG